MVLAAVFAASMSIAYACGINPDGSHRTDQGVAPKPSAPATNSAADNTPPTTANDTGLVVQQTATAVVPATTPSGRAMPVGNPVGWKQIFTEDFTKNVPVGSFPGTAYSAKWEVYKDGWPDTAGKEGGTPSQYEPSKVLSVTNGYLNMHLHTENGIHMVSAPMPKMPNGAEGQIYGMYTVRFRADAIPGYATAWLLWPDSEKWPADGEVDFPEANLNDNSINAYMHYAQASGGQDAFSIAASYTSWHTATTEWQPGRITFYMDGYEIGHSTTHVPTDSMHYVLQTETAGIDQQPSDAASGNVQVDWVAIYSRA